MAPVSLQTVIVQPTTVNSTTSACPVGGASVSADCYVQPTTVNSTTSACPVGGASVSADCYCPAHHSKLYHISVSCWWRQCLRRLLCPAHHSKLYHISVSCWWRQCLCKLLLSSPPQKTLPHQRVLLVAPVSLQIDCYCPAHHSKLYHISVSCWWRQCLCRLTVIVQPTTVNSTTSACPVGGASVSADCYCPAHHRKLYHISVSCWSCQCLCRLTVIVQPTTVNSTTSACPVGGASVSADWLLLSSPPQ